MPLLRFEHLHRADGFLSPGYVTVDDRGFIERVSDSVAPGTPVTAEFAGYAVPGMPNVHSHAFQRVFAGHTERAGIAPQSREDSFWTWRDAMYRIAQALEEADVAAIAALVQMEMLEAGYTSVGEFHYLHHRRDGSPHEDPSALARAILRAAERTKIAITLLPVAYLHAGFGRPLASAQRRFGSRDVAEFLDLWHACRDAVKSHGEKVRIGVAPHSLRAVSGDELAAIVAAVGAAEPLAPVHIHVAEQRAEVEQAREALGTTPIAWLADSIGIDERWCLVHATHAAAAEITKMASSGCVVGLCPTTEANLGDGIFPLVDHLGAGGRIAIGSDSQISVDAAEELRWLEYTQRLTSEKRNRAADGAHDVRRHTGRRLYDAALAGGARALQQPVGAIEVGRRCDIVVLDSQHPRLLGHGPATILDAHLFSATSRGAIQTVLLGGEVVVERGVHREREPIVREAKDTIARLSEILR
ncbi:MAG: formimidoylglutamate deiminase [Planctomycetota bacterium]